MKRKFISDPIFSGLKPFTLTGEEKPQEKRTYNLYSYEECIARLFGHQGMYNNKWREASGKIVAAFWWMHVSPAETYLCVTTKKVWLPDRQIDKQTDAGQSDPYVPLCFAGDTKRTYNLYSYEECIARLFGHKVIYCVYDRKVAYYILSILMNDVFSQY